MKQRVQSILGKSLSNQLTKNCAKSSFAIFTQIRRFHALSQRMAECGPIKHSKLSSCCFSTKYPKHKVISLPSLSPSMETVS